MTTYYAAITITFLVARENAAQSNIEAKALTLKECLRLPNIHT